MYLQFALHTSDEVGAVGACGNQTRYSLPVLGNHDPFRLQILENSQALLFEFRGINGLHDLILGMDTIIV